MTIIEKVQLLLPDDGRGYIALPDEPAPGYQVTIRKCVFVRQVMGRAVYIDRTQFDRFEVTYWREVKNVKDSVP